MNNLFIFYFLDSFFVPIDFFREATPESASGFEVRRKEEGWIYFDRNGYLLKDSRRKRRGVEISFVFNENGTGATAGATASTSSAQRKSYGKTAGSPIKKSPPRAGALKGSQRVTRSPPSASSGTRGSAARGSGVRGNVATASGISRTQQKRTVTRVEYKPKPIDSQTQHQIDADMKRICGDIKDTSQSHINHLDKNVEGLKEVARQIESTIDEIEQVRQRDIKNVRSNTLDKLDSLVHRSDGLAALHDAQNRLTEKQNVFLEKEHHLNSLRHGNTLLTAILNKATDLNGDRDQLYSKFNEILSKNLDDQRTEVLKLLQETESESKVAYKSTEIDRALNDIASAIKTTAVDEISKREGLLEQFQRDQQRAKEKRDDVNKKISKADDDIRNLNKHIDKQKKEVDDKEKNLAKIRDDIIKERQGLVQDENRNADLEKKLQEMKNKLRFFEQEKLYLLTEKNINNTKVNIQEQLYGERDKAMADWMKDRIQDEKNKKAALEDKMNQCYSFETKEVVDLFKKEKKLQGDQREEFINSLKEELDQKLENEKVIKGHVEASAAELKKLRKTSKKAPEADEDLDFDHEKLYGDLKEVTLDNLEKNQSLATSQKDVKELEVKILLIQDDINNLKSSCEELEIILSENQREYQDLDIDESELERLKKELKTKKSELRRLEDQRADMMGKIAEAEREYKSIKTTTTRRFVMKEINEEGEEVKITTTSKVQSSYYSPQRVNLSPEEIRKTRLSQSPSATREIDNIMKEIYYGRPGPKIRKTDDGTFIYGTREFVVWKEGSKLYARDLEGDAREKEELENYLKIHEIKERETALRTNLEYLNDDIGSEDEEMAEVGEEFVARDMSAYGRFQKK